MHHTIDKSKIYRKKMLLLCYRFVCKPHFWMAVYYISKQTKPEQLMRDCSLIVWDEISMTS